MRSPVVVLYFVILQVLWAFRSLYELVVPEKNKEQISLQRPEPVFSDECEPEARHLIHLFTSTPRENHKRPVCYMHVCEIISPYEEDMLRCTCGKGAKMANIPHKIPTPPSEQISRQSFTYAWMESFSLVG